MNNWDKHLDPPEEQEDQFCDECGDELEYVIGLARQIDYWKCNNKFCPSKYTGLAAEMAITLVEYVDECRRLKERLNYISRYCNDS